MKGLKKAIAGAFLICASFIWLGIEAYASTGIYVGKDVSSEGTTLIGVSTEYTFGMATVPVVVDKGMIHKGDEIKSVKGFTYTMPDDNARMTLVHLMSYFGEGKYGAAASNEYGVSVLSWISTNASEDAL